ncbi:MAG: alpha/beta hydrolase [Chloroflexia bacterium]
MSDWRSEYVVVGGIRLHYTRTGGSKPPLVLAHGVTDDGLCWTPVAQALAAEYDVVMLDARGHGLSDAPEHGYGPAQQAGDLAGVIAALGLERPAVLGHSMGAATTLVAAGLYPDPLSGRYCWKTLQGGGRRRRIGRRAASIGGRKCASGLRPRRPNHGMS